MSDVKRAKTLVGAALLTFGLLSTGPEATAQPKGHGSVRHSSKKTKTKSGSASRTTVTTTRTTSDRGTAARGTTARRTTSRRSTTTTRRSSRAGYRAGYRHGRYHGWNDAWRSYRRRRAVTGLFRLGVKMATRPPRTTTTVVYGTTYYYSGGVYYVPSGTGYVVVSAPPGAVVYAVPEATTVVYVQETPYYYYAGTYYVPTNAPAEEPPPDDTVDVAALDEAGAALAEIPMVEDDQNFEVVASPVGATVPYLPDEASEEVVGGKKYLVYDDNYYRAFVSDGETVYMVVENPRA